MADAFDMYRRSVIGVALLETLNEMVDCGKLSLDLAINVLLQFDKSMSHALDKHVTSRATFKGGNLRTYRYYDSVWTLNLRNTTFKNEEIEVVLPKTRRHPKLDGHQYRLWNDPQEHLGGFHCART
uniref:Transcription initiation factor IIA subunit 2 n=1 Tax=Hordeum vulgare subsp. vulgare TaxID=112509 RepID=A0A8I6XVK7_HORVV